MISAFILISSTDTKKNKKEIVIIKSGVNIDWSIEGDDNLDMLAGWCNVFHQSTDHFIMGKLTIPTTASMDAYLSPFDLSS